jgi:hypothetical protein
MCWFSLKAPPGSNPPSTCAAYTAGFVVAYPSLNTSELTRTKELYDGERSGTSAGGGGRPVVVCNGELERTRSNYYPPFWNAAEMAGLALFHT